MSENLDHEAGGTFVDGDVCTKKCLNTKEVIIQSANPGVAYDGQMFVDIDDNGPQLRIYDVTNTEYMTRPNIRYSSVANGFKSPATTHHVNGVISIHHDTDDNKIYMYVRANSVWYGARPA